MNKTSRYSNHSDDSYLDIVGNEILFMIQEKSRTPIILKCFRCGSFGNLEDSCTNHGYSFSDDEYEDTLEEPDENLLMALEDKEDDYVKTSQKKVEIWTNAKK